MGKYIWELLQFQQIANSNMITAFMDASFETL